MGPENYMPLSDLKHEAIALIYKIFSKNLKYYKSFFHSTRILGFPLYTYALVSLSCSFKEFGSFPKGFPKDSEGNSKRKTNAAAAIQMLKFIIFENTITDSA